MLSAAKYLGLNLFCTGFRQRPFASLRVTNHISRFKKHSLTELTGEPRTDLALAVVIRDYARHKLTDIEDALRRYEEKYKMSFDAYQQVWETREREEHYNYEAEWDYLEWEGLVTLHKRVAESYAWLP